MATESLTLVGYREFKNHSTSDGSDKKLKLVPNSKNNCHMVPQWWDRKPGNKLYIAATKIAVDGTDFVIVIPSSFSTRLGIRLVDGKELIFSGFGQVKRAGVFNKDTGELVTEYLFPKIKGGTVVVNELVDLDPDGGTDPEPEPEPEPDPDPTGLVTAITATAEPDTDGVADQEIPEVETEGGSGSGLKLSIKCENEVLSYTIIDPGEDYEVGDEITPANKAGLMADFVWEVAAIDGTRAKKKRKRRVKL